MIVLCIRAIKGMSVDLNKMMRSILNSQYHRRKFCSKHIKPLVSFFFTIRWNRKQQSYLHAFCLLGVIRVVNLWTCKVLRRFCWSPASSKRGDPGNYVYNLTWNMSSVTFLSLIWNITNVMFSNSIDLYTTLETLLWADAFVQNYTIVL